MSKRTLVGSYTAPKDAFVSKQELTTKHVVGADDYKNKKYSRNLDVHLIQTYKERLASVKAKLEDKASAQNGQATGGADGPVQPKLLLASESQEQAQDGEPKDDKQDTSQLPPAKKPRFALPTANGKVLTDEVLDSLIPKGFVVLAPPEGFGEKLILLYEPPTVSNAQVANETLPEFEGIPMRKEDVKHFVALVTKDSTLGKREHEALALVFRIKNGPQIVRKRSTRALQARATELGAKPIFDALLPVMLEPTLDETDRHAMTKLIGRMAVRLGPLVRPHTYQVISAVLPLLIDENMTLRVEAREVISHVAQAAGFASVVSALRPDLDHADEYVRNLTSRVLAVVTVAFGLPKVLPFLKAIVRSKSAHARHTGIRSIHHLCIQLGGNGAAVIPHLPDLVDVLIPGFDDDLVNVRTATANAFAQLAELVSPFGIAAFEPALEPVWNGIVQLRGRLLAAHLLALGAMISLMVHDEQYTEYSNYYTKELMRVVTREFGSVDDDMKKSVLRVLTGVPLSTLLFPNYARTIVAPYFQHFWTRRIASEPGQLYRLVVDLTVSIASIDVPLFIKRLTPLAKDPNENLRRMACDVINKILSTSPEHVVEMDRANDSNLVDALLYAFQEQNPPHIVYLKAFSTTCRALGLRLEPQVPMILSSMLYRLKSSEPEIRQQSADLLAAIADTVMLCSHGDTTTIKKLVLFLYELLGEVYPEVLGSLIGALYACVATLDPTQLLSLENPSLNILLPTLTPILKNRHEKVQEQCIKLVGFIAKRDSESINAKEWMRVCFDLLDMLKSQRRKIRVAANATFGEIARTIGPLDVLAMLLNNFRVQERQLRVCTAVAVGIVADTCSPFTVLPALMNEYRFPDKNVQNGVLKALSFLFEYLDGSTSKDYLFAITPLLEDALTDRDQVHRQTAATVVKHMALNCHGICHDEYQDVFMHFLNLVLPNILETSPHVILRVLECLDALRIVLGPGVFFNYIWVGMFHAARKVRTPYWRLYNSAYVQNCDQLVPCYPRVDHLAPDHSKKYSVEELDIWM